MAFRHDYNPRLGSLPRSPKVGNDGYTVLMLQMNGSDGSTTFTDECSGRPAHTVTVNGSAQIDTAQSKFGGASGRFDSAGSSYLNLDGTDFAFGTGDFTVDFWVRMATVPTSGNNIWLYDSRPNVHGAYPAIIMRGPGIISYITNTAEPIITTTTMVADTWYHICLARAGTSTKMFIDGVKEGATYSDSTNYLNGASRPTLAASGFPGDPDYADCWLDGFRVSKGIARWTESFTPPTVPYERKAKGYRQSYSNFQKHKLTRKAA